MNIQIYTACSQDYRYKREDIHQFITDCTFKNPVMEAKQYKVLGHKYFPNYDYLIWIDSNIWYKFDKDKAVNDYLQDNDLVVFKHPHRNCIYQEFLTLRTDPRFRNSYLQKQLKEQEKYYRKSGHPENYGLWECNFIIRKVNAKTNNLFNDWWSEICRWQWRDQVSFPFVLRQHKLKFRSFEGYDIRRRPEFIYKNHY